MEREIYNDFAWECLRRNPRYISDWETIKVNIHQEANPIQPESELIQSELDLRAEDKWGLLKYLSPLNSNPKDVFWSPYLSNRSMNADFVKNGKRREASTWGDISRIPGINYNFLRMRDDTLCVKIFNNDEYFQLFFKDADLFTEDLCIYINTPIEIKPESFSKKIGILQSIVNQYSYVENKDERYQSLLEILDYSKKGFSHRDVALKFFGNELVNREWSADSWIRAKIRYQIKKANELINHGYLNFL